MRSQYLRFRIKTLAEYVEQEMPRSIARDSDFQDTVAVALRSNPEAAKGPKGDSGSVGQRGPAGRDGPTLSQVTTDLITNKATELGKAVINADSLNQQHPLSSKITYWVKDLLRRDQEFRNDVKGDPGEDGISTSADDVSSTLIRDDTFIQKILLKEMIYPRQSGDRIPRKLSDWVTYLLKQDDEFKRSVKGDTGPTGLRGPVGPRGNDADSSQVATKLLNSSNIDQLVNRVLIYDLIDPKDKQPKRLSEYVANKLVADKATELGNAVLGIKELGKSKLSVELAGSTDLQQGVANKLKTDPGKARGPEGKVGPIGLQGPEGKQGQKGDKGDSGAIGPPGEKGDPGKDSDPSEIVHRLAHSSRFKRSLKGEDGEPGYDGKKGDQGQPGIEGLPGLDGRDGRDADPAEVAEKLISNKTDELVNIIRQEVVDRVTTWGASKRLVDSLTYDDILRIIEGKADTGRHKLFERLLSNANLQDPSKAKTFIGNEVAGNVDLQNAVADALRNDPGNARGPRGRDGRKGERGEDGAAGPQGDLGQDADPSEVVHRLAHSSRFKRLLKGEDGEKGEQGPPGQDGVDGVQGPRGRAGEKGKKGDQGERGEDGEIGVPGLPGERGPAGRDGVNSFAMDSKLQKSIEDLQKKPALKIVPGDTNENIQEANIELEGVGVIATFLEIGYFFKGNNLYIRNHITGKSILIPQDFHFLKVVEDGLDNYKLAFCNYLGNLFFDYKKYNSEYADVLEKYKAIDLRYIKNAANIDLSKYYYMHSPLFAVKQGEFEAQSTENRSADVYEIVKDKKIGTLVDEFGFFEHEKFYYVSYHQEYDHDSQELNVTIEDHEGNFQIGDNIIHPIILHNGHLDLLDYLGYQNEFI